MPGPRGELCKMEDSACRYKTGSKKIQIGTNYNGVLTRVVIGFLPNTHPHSPDITAV